MNYLPKSIIGWIFIFIFLITQIASNPAELLERLELGENFLVLSLDYLVFPIATGYLIFFVFSNIYQLLKPRNKENNLSNTINNSKKLKTSEILEKELEELEEIEKVKKLKDEINEKRKSLNLNSLDHFDAIVQKISKYRKKLKKQRNLYEDLLRFKKNNLIVLIFFTIIYGLVIYYQISIRDLLGNTTILLTIVGFTLAGLLLYKRFRNLSIISKEVFEKILELELSLKDLELEKKKNEPTELE